MQAELWYFDENACEQRIMQALPFVAPGLHGCCHDKVLPPLAPSTSMGPHVEARTFGNQLNQPVDS